MRVASFAEQGAIVRDEQQRAAVAQQEIFQPADGVDVEVVGRLVQQQEVRAADQGLGQQHAAFHAGGKGRHVGVRLEAHARDDGFDLLVHAPAAVGFQRVLDAAQLRLKVVASLAGQPARQVVILGQQFRLGAETPGDLVEDRAVKVPRHFLGEHGGPQPLLPDDLAPIGLRVALEQAQERRLAGAVAAQEAHPLARLNRQIGLIQDQRAAKAQIDVGQRD